jgi:hydrogen peroxide-dependent heme synthase
VRQPGVNETIEGWWILHRMFAFDRRRWALIPRGDGDRIANQAVDALQQLKTQNEGDVALAQLVGHKADLMFTHYAREFDGLATAQTHLDRCELFEYLEPRESYVSVLELGLYEATGKIHALLDERGLKRFSADWNDAFDALLKEQVAQPRNAGRLWARIPQRRYVCFYPMDKRREGDDNWYMLPFGQRAKLMLDHGKIGRSFHGVVTQVISGSIGFDDYEWGVDLYADDPLAFKKLIYEMRFDEASARYASFGQFFSGIQFSIEEVPVFLAGESLPVLRSHDPVEA